MNAATHTAPPKTANMVDSAAPAAGAPVAAAAAVGSKKAASQEPRRVKFSVGTKYQVETVIGEGAYGVVCSAIHRPTGIKVAIKKIQPFDHTMCVPSGGFLLCRIFR